MNLSALTLISLLLVAAKLVNARNDDQFNYRETDGRDFGPLDWDDVTCDDPGECLGYPFDGWTQARGWSLRGNNCEWCPAGSNRCGGHRQSPIELNRDVGNPNDKSFDDPMDWHWMKYERRSCNWKDIIDNPEAVTPNQFRIERHALVVRQPVGTDNQPKCPSGQGGGLFPRVDFSKGYKWWWLVSTEIKVPSEHFQNGKQYDAEVHLSHGYSLTPEEHRSNREMGKIAMFMHVYDNVAPWPFLDKLICQWRKVEDEVREGCGLGSVTTHYPGCWPFNRPDPSTSTSGANRKGRNLRTASEPRNENEFERMRRIELDPENWEQDPAYTKEDFWQEIEDYNSDYERQYHSNATAEGGHRFLMNYDHVMYHPYEWMFKAGTEYYFRYEGTQTNPPCFEQLHWRFLKDPIRIHRDQLNELSRLLADRIAPAGSEINECQADTAGKPRNDGTGFVDTNRPLQYVSNTHGLKFTDCKDWGSKQEGDKQWCKIDSLQDRLYNHPYNWDHDGF